MKQKAKELNWVIIAFVVVLSYGFLMANPSIGIDDENFNFYFKYNGIVASGRWGSWLIKHIADSYAYLPVWRDMLAIGLLVVTAMMFLCAAEKAGRKKISPAVSTAVTAVMISYPIIAKMFIYLDNSVETTMCLLAATAAAYLITGQEMKGKDGLIRYAAALGLLTLGCSLIENTLLYFGAEICLFSCMQERKDRFVRDLLIPAALCAGAMLISKLAGKVIASALGIYYADYGTTSYLKWGEIKGLGGLKAAVREMLVNYRYWFLRYFSVKLFTAAAAFWTGRAVWLLTRKKGLKALYAIGIVGASLGMYLITMNGGLPLRIFTCYVIPVTGCAIWIGQWIEGRKEGTGKRILAIAAAVVCGLCVFRETKESNEYYQLDYKRYLRDADVARNVNGDLERLIGGMPEKPVVFIGQPEQAGDINPESEFALVTIYSNNEEGKSIRIHRFFSMLGYAYPDVIDGEITVHNIEERNGSPLIAKAREEAKGMMSYPKDGYIKELDDVIIIKLGD